MVEMQSIMQDLRYAVRQLRRSPGFAATTVTVLALGLGANLAVFTVLNGILLRPLPYRHPERIAKVELSGPMPYYSMSYANMLQLRDAVGSRLQIGATFGDSMASVVGPGGRLQVENTQVTAGLPAMLGVQPIMGRLFHDEENDPGRNQVALIGEDVWRTLYHSDAKVIGQTLVIKKLPYTIIGVMPKGFQFPFDREKQVLTPVEINAANRAAIANESSLFCDLYARLPEGMSEALLADQLSRTQAEIAKQNSKEDLPSQVKVTNYQQSLSNDARKPLLLLYAVVFGIWLLACLNVTSLMLARAVARSRELAVRSALGAGRWRLLQQSMVESLLLSGIGAVFGLLLGESAIKIMWVQIQRRLPLKSAIHLDGRVIALLIVLTLLTALIVGILPALRAARRSVQSSLHGVTSTASASQSRTREALVVAQIALTLVFLVGAGLFLRTIHAMRSVPLGFSEQNVLTGGIILNGMSNGDDSQTGTDKQADIIQTQYLPLLEKLRAIPGVRDAALSSVLPMRAEFAVSIITRIDHQQSSSVGQMPKADGRLASAGLVSALGIPMKSGRFFTESDMASSPIVAVVNEAFARRYLPNQNAVGHVLSMARQGPFYEIQIVGVIGDMKQLKVTDETKPEIYFCLAQMGVGTPLYGVATAFIQVAIRGAVPAETLRAQFDKALHEVAPEATTTNVKTIHEAVEDSFGSQRLIANLLEGFAGLALLIASVGLYGLLSFNVAQRSREIGLRMALGAQPESIVRLVLKRALLLVAVGLSVGGVLAWFATRLASSYLYGVEAHDALTFVAVVLVLSAAVMLASWLPARRASAVDPMMALRSE
jgi:predicted permease